MQILEKQVVVRELITEADHLSRQFHLSADDAMAGRLAGLRSTLQRLDRALGGASADSSLIGEIDVVYQRIVDITARASGADLHALRASAARLRPPALPSVSRFPSRGVSEPGATVIPPPPIGVDSRGPEGSSLVQVSNDVRATIAPLSFAVALGALVVPGIVPALRRSAVGWGTAGGVALFALGVGRVLKLRSHRSGG